MSNDRKPSARQTTDQMSNDRKFTDQMSSARKSSDPMTSDRKTNLCKNDENAESQEEAKFFLHKDSMKLVKWVKTKIDTSLSAKPWF